MTHRWRHAPAQIRLPLIRRVAIVLAICPVGLLAAVAVYLLAALLLGLIPVGGDRGDDNGIAVFIRGNGVHADLVVPMVAGGVDWRTRLPIAALHPIAGVTEDLAFGWGDRGFYLTTPTWSDLRVATAFRALTGLDRTVLRAEAVPVPAPDPEMREVRLSPEHYRALAAFIAAAIRVGDDGGAIVIPGAHYDAHDIFLEANGHYSIFETCNEWTRQALAVAGVRVPAWSPFQQALFYQLPSGAPP